MLLAVVLASALFLCSSASQGCFTSIAIRNVVYLIDNLQKNTSSNCSCSTDATDCLCLPISSGNCTTACFQEGLSQLSNSTVNTKFHLIVNQVKKTVVTLKNNKCGSFACGQPCNRTTTGNTLTFLKTLLESFQNERMKGKV
ncbi:interleukin-9 [Moschus berezovskii]|uniref:interleukin-9 n=1 Tax=Moschus berezovskii TaxID=68408 RepID=UPI0024442649|nr:interleukin-9 [Moschus berezovskii]